MDGLSVHTDIAPAALNHGAGGRLFGMPCPGIFFSQKRFFDVAIDKIPGKRLVKGLLAVYQAGAVI